MVKNTHLVRIRPATSYVAATFHPTIGQRAHQSLSNTATPKLGMIPQGIRVKAGLHIAKVHKSSNPTDRKSTRLNSSHFVPSRMPSSA